MSIAFQSLEVCTGYNLSNGVRYIYDFDVDSGKFIPTRRTPGVSTSELLERMVVGYRHGDWDPKLEKMGHPELKSRQGSPLLR
jgi:choline-phosphate cytidylyltransferase